ncbi:MAG: hypothetical protein ABR538_11290 [Candidatus Binatia bacterium]
MMSLPAFRLALPVFLLVLAVSGIAGATDPPIPAPGQSLPPHAAGGWPTATTGDDKKPGRTPEQQAHLDAVTGELKRLANESGPDSVVLQAKLLVRSMGAGSVGPTEVRVAGESATAGPGFLGIVVTTGLYFDAKTTTGESRRESAWKDVALPVLDEMVSFKIEPSGLELVLLFDVQEFGGGEAPAADPTSPSTPEAFRVELGKALLEDLVADRLVGEAVRAQVQFLDVAPPPPPVAAPAP